MTSFASNGQFLASVMLILGMLDSAEAAADFKKCCVISARAQYSLFAPVLPWDACGVNSNATGSSAPINPSVNTTLGWCEQNCPGYQPSTVSEWLHPVTTWLIPYAGLLFLCPIGERGETAAARSISWFLQWFGWLPLTWRDWLNRDIIKFWTAPIMKWVSNLIFSLSEYGIFLGDPASSIWGSFSALAEDWWLSGIVLHMTDLRRELVAAVILTGQSELDGLTEKKLTNTLVTRCLLDIASYEESREKRRPEDEKAPATKSEAITPIDSDPPELIPLSSKGLSQVVVEQVRSSPLTTREVRKKLENSLGNEPEDLWQGIDMHKVAKAVVDIAEGHDVPPDLFSGGSMKLFTNGLDQILENHIKRNPLERKKLLLQGGTFTHRLWDGIRDLLEARVDFVNTILIPVILMLVVTASVFYDAYQALGDSDTAFSLAYGLFYSWLIILAVASNCYTSSLTSGLVERTIGNDGNVLPISSVTVGLCSRYTNALRWHHWLVNVGVVDDPVGSRTRVLAKYLAGQLFGWICVAIVASCGAAVSYTTPTVGIGCRSFNMLLYTLVSLVVCLIPVLLYWNKLRDTKGDERGVDKKKAKFNKYVSYFYRFLVFANGCVLLIGTLLHLIGVFRSCWCQNVFARQSRILELNTQTHQAVHNATVYWLPVGYVAFIFIWCMSASAIVMRQVINFRVNVMQTLHLGETTGHADATSGGKPGHRERNVSSGNASGEADEHRSDSETEHKG